MINIFDIDEQIVINRTTAAEQLNKFTKAKLLNRIDFVLAIIEDKDIYNLYEGLKDKIIVMTEDEWGQIKDVLPFKTPYSEEDLAAG